MEEMSDVCSQISEKYCGNIDEDYIDDKYLETWEYKTLSEIKSLEIQEEN